MTSITPCQRTVSDRFPVASFVVHVPPERVFEIACATDPLLLGSEHQARRTPSNFFTTRAGGLLRAPAGQATYLVPPDQLRRFAGATRLYYALGSYGGVRGENPAFSVPLDAPETAPCIQIAPDFSGKTLDRTRFGQAAPAEARYGAQPVVLTWGGDQGRRPAAPAKAAPAKASPKFGNAGAVALDDYDDGFDPGLWSEGASAGTGALGGADVSSVEEPDGYEDAPDLRRHVPETYGATSRRQTPPRTAPAPRAPAPRAAPAPRPAPRPLPPAQVAPLPRSGGAGETYGSRQARVAPPPMAPGAADTYRSVSGAHGQTAVHAPAGRTTYGGVAAPAAPARYAGPEPEGFEDAPALARARLGGRGRFGDAAARPAAPPPTDDAGPPIGRSETYDEDDSDDDDWDQGMAARALDAPARVPLTIPEKFRIVSAVAPFESGADRYAAINADGEYNDPHHPAYQRFHIGLSWGLIQFTQRGGMLGRALRACDRRDHARFQQEFGPSADDLIRVTNLPGEEDRVQAVGGSFLWEPAWTARFQSAGAVAAFQAAQNEVAIEGYVDPNLQFAAWLGFETDRALSMLLDRCVHMGNGGGRRWVARTVMPIRKDDLPAALAAINFRDLQSFQQSVAGLTADGKWGPQTHAALVGALRAAGVTGTFAVPPLSDLLDRLVDASRGHGFERRVRALRTSTGLNDTLYQIP